MSDSVIHCEGTNRQWSKTTSELWIQLTRIQTLQRLLDRLVQGRSLLFDPRLELLQVRIKMFPYHIASVLDGLCGEESLVEVVTTYNLFDKTHLASVFPIGNMAAPNEFQILAILCGALSCRVVCLLVHHHRLLRSDSAFIVLDLNIADRLV